MKVRWFYAQRTILGKASHLTTNLSFPRILHIPRLQKEAGLTGWLNLHAATRRLPLTF